MSPQLPRIGLQALRSRQTPFQPLRQRYRHASSSTGPIATTTRIKTVAYSTIFAALGLAGYLYATDTRSKAHQYLVPPLLRAIYSDAEDAHHAGTSLLRTLYNAGLHPRERADETDLGVTVFDGVRLVNPIGISAGLDKDARIPDALFELGAAVVEVGGITARPQEGNPRPRVWRVPALEGLVNCYGLNSRGADAVARTLRARVRKFAAAKGVSEEDVLAGRAGVPAGSLRPGKLLCVQIAKNKGGDGEDDAAKDYVYCAERLARYADVVVVNVSSPNTAGLRGLQERTKLQRLLTKVVSTVESEGRKIGRKPKVMVKVSPDEDSDDQIKGVVYAVWDSGADGVIVGNTTNKKLKCGEGVPLSNREQSILAMPEGGFSGPPMFERTLKLVQRYREHLDVPTFEERKTVFATGGITNGEQAYKMAQAGADLSMVYTALVYGGAGTVTRIKEEMRREVHKGKDRT